MGEAWASMRYGFQQAMWHLMPPCFLQCFSAKLCIRYSAISSASSLQVAVLSCKILILQQANVTGFQSTAVVVPFTCLIYLHQPQ